MACMTRILLLTMLVAIATAKNKLMPYPGDCSTFYQCSSEKCPDGMIFDPDALACYPPMAMGNPRPQPREETATFPDDNDNTMYWVCTRMPCPPGLEFNPVKLMCQDPMVAGCRH